MKNEHNTAWASYDFESAKYFNSYKKLYFSKVHKQFVRFLSKDTNSEILDIGCGSGRDALSLARRGYKVTAVEPSEKMLNLAKEKSNHKNIYWIKDSLPHLLKLGQNTYNFILISAVWMHIEPHDRKKSLRRISELMEAGGQLAITLRLGIPDPSRRMYPISAEEFLAQAADENLTPIYISKITKDSLNRRDVTWKKLVLQKN